MEEKLTTVEEVCDEVEALGGLEGEVELDDERVRDLLHDVTLNLRVVHLVCTDDEVLLERLDSIDLPCVLLLGQVDLAKAAPADHLDQLEVLNAHIALLTIE